MKRINLYISLLTLMFVVVPGVTSAQVCFPNANIVNTYAASKVSRRIGGGGTATAMFAAGGCSQSTNLDGVKFGTNVANCSFAVAGGGSNFGVVRFDSATANTTMNGCSFVCGTETCQMRGSTSLPVELMEFSVE